MSAHYRMDGTSTSTHAPYKVLHYVTDMHISFHDEKIICIYILPSKKYVYTPIQKVCTYILF